MLKALDRAASFVSAIELVLEGLFENYDVGAQRRAHDSNNFFSVKDRDPNPKMDVVQEMKREFLAVEEERYLRTRK